MTCAEITLSGVVYPIPFDEMVDAMYKVGKSIPFELRETAIGGCAEHPPDVECVAESDGKTTEK